jgi:PEP-CTERM motif-containing protein
MGFHFRGMGMRYLALIAAIFIVLPTTARADVLPIIDVNDTFAGILTIHDPGTPPTGNVSGFPYWISSVPGDLGTITAQIGTLGVFTGNLRGYTPGSDLPNGPSYSAAAQPISLNGSAPLPYSEMGMTMEYVGTGFFPSGRFVIATFGIDYQLISSNGSQINVSASSADVPTFILISSSPDQESFAFSGVITGVSVSTVPEPSTWAMLLIGFIGIGFALRGKLEPA